MVALDTNILVYAFTDAFPRHAVCRALLTEFVSSREPWAIAWPSVYEFMRVVTHPRVLKPAAHWESAYAFLEGLWESPSLSMLTHQKDHSHLMKSCFEEQGTLQGNFFHDCHIAILLKEHGEDKIISDDRDFNRFSFLKRYAPEEWLARKKG